MKWILRNEKGQNLVEMALVMMLLLLLLAGAVDIGRAFHDYIIITNAAREGARTGARLPCTATNRAALKNAIQNAAISEAANSGVSLSASNITIAPDPIAGCASADTVVKTIAVTITYSFVPILTSVVGYSSFDMQNSAKMLAYGNDQ